MSIQSIGGYNYEYISNLLNKFGYTLSQLSDGTLIVYQKLFKEIVEGNAYSISHRFEGVANDASVEVVFTNPSASGKTAYLIVVEISSFGQAHADVYKGASITSSGTSLTPTNLNFGSTKSAVCEVEYGGTYSTSGATQTHNTVIPGGSHPRVVGGLVEVGESLIVPENNTLLFRATNKSGTSTDMSIRILWWEG